MPYPPDMYMFCLWVCFSGNKSPFTHLADPTMLTYDTTILIYTYTYCVYMNIRNMCVYFFIHTRIQNLSANP